ncbi:hypothetical protein [Nonomuraea sp. B19D2]|uniref:hypothetical protein n=1 Tax=Nonomuraea sp. B19D2 TaxID=3159561 RepID=UPI0032DA66B1
MPDAAGATSAVSLSVIVDYSVLSSGSHVVLVAGGTLKAFIRIAVIAVMGGSTLLAANTASASEPPRADSLLTRLFGADVGSLIDALPSVFCGNRLVSYNSPAPNSPTKCVNGAENSGNSTNSGNYHNDGDPINSGNFANTNGSTGSSNIGDGGNIANGFQSRGKR